MCQKRKGKQALSHLDTGGGGGVAGVGGDPDAPTQNLTWALRVTPGAGRRPTGKDNTPLSSDPWERAHVWRERLDTLSLDKQKALRLRAQGLRGSLPWSWQQVRGCV